MEKLNLEISDMLHNLLKKKGKENQELGQFAGWLLKSLNRPQDSIQRKLMFGVWEF
jgi:hypothetical protein